MTSTVFAAVIVGGIGAVWLVAVSCRVEAT